MTQSTHALSKTLADSLTLRDRKLLQDLNASLSLYLDEHSAAQSSPVNAQSLNALLETIGEARGLPLKIAQMVAFLDPRSPDELRDVLEVIQNRRRAMPFEQVEQIFEREFGCHPDTLFDEFVREPVAAASIAQVHRGRLQDGTWVAVKIQYPEIHAKMQSYFHDLEFVNQLSHLLGNERNAIQRLIADFHQTVLEECDFEREAANQHRFYEMFESDVEIIIPKVHFSYSRKNILTTTWCNGKTWQQFKTSATQNDRNQATKTISRFYAQSGFIHGFVQTDPHPWNYLFSDGQVIFLDFGRVKSISANFRSELHQLHSLLLNSDKEGTRKFITSSEIIKLKSPAIFDQLWEVLMETTQHLRRPGSVSVSKESLRLQRTKMRELGKTAGIEVCPEFFWTAMFCHCFMMTGRADFEADSNWRKILMQNM